MVTEESKDNEQPTVDRSEANSSFVAWSKSLEYLKAKFAYKSRVMILHAVVAGVTHDSAPLSESVAGTLS